MKKILLVLFLTVVFLTPIFAWSQTVNVKGYTRKDGTSVAPYTRSAPGSKSSSSSSSEITSSYTRGTSLSSSDSTSSYISGTSLIGNYVPNTTSSDSNENSAMVCKVVDGDTLKLCNGEIVRLIGIETPEKYGSEKVSNDSQWLGKDTETIIKLCKQAYVFTEKLCDSKQINMEFDIDKKDKYGRLLVYAFLNDGTFVNAEIIRQGYAKPVTISPNVKYADLFSKLYQEARENKRGLWNEQRKNREDGPIDNFIVDVKLFFVKIIDLIGE